MLLSSLGKDYEQKKQIKSTRNLGTCGFGDTGLNAQKLKLRCTVLQSLGSK